MDARVTCIHTDNKVEFRPLLSNVGFSRLVRAGIRRAPRAVEVWKQQTPSPFPIQDSGRPFELSFSWKHESGSMHWTFGCKRIPLFFYSFG